MTQNPVVKASLSDLQDSGSDTRARSTVLHISGQSEIDYTASGHRVAQHMENALNELDSLEDHVKSGMPKYLKESAVQREADLMNHKFTRDLQGSGRKKIEYAQSTSTPLQKTSHRLNEVDHAPPKPPQPKVKKETFHIKTGQSIVNQVVAAAKMDAKLTKEDHDTMKSFSTTAKKIAKGWHDAEKEADHVTAKQFPGSFLQSKTTASSPVGIHNSKAAASASSHVTEKADNTFVPITEQGLGSTQQHASVQAAGARAGGGDDAKDEAIVRQLAEGGKGSLPAAAAATPSARGGGGDAKAKALAAVHAKAAAAAAAATTTSGGGGKIVESKKLGEMKKTATGKAKGDGKEEGGEAAQLNGVLSRIDKLIGGYTGGANSNPSFFRHFDSEAQAGGSATLGAKGDAPSPQSSSLQAAAPTRASAPPGVQGERGTQTG
eukprot:CAMPEP_0181322208 /NCGR_PEP_ID=MMETSP1101-20121128/19105_1 /TAXON_ID=46948 /ORGANISM="Rhodomonas abbreviata, Strain Caron Lab Isolate" /LENGTH=434 /DNA_ID=CAMNT_0023430105 /DNA_START=453 /DNA_END=1753 /DNA_ORIENTATION=-